MNKEHVEKLIDDRVKELDKKIQRLEKTLGTCISWHQNEFGVAAVEQLLEMLNKE